MAFTSAKNFSVELRALVNKYIEDDKLIITPAEIIGNMYMVMDEVSFRALDCGEEEEEEEEECP